MDRGTAHLLTNRHLLKHTLLLFFLALIWKVSGRFFVQVPSGVPLSVEQLVMPFVNIVLFGILIAVVRGKYAN